MNTEGRPPAVIVFLGSGKAERKPPHLSASIPARYLAVYDRAPRSIVVVRCPGPGRASGSHARSRTRRLGAVETSDRAHAE